MKFWQKTYLLTLALFLLFMDGGIFSLAVYANSKTMDSTVAAARAEQYYIAGSLERDISDAGADKNESRRLQILQSYCTFYEKHSVKLAFVEGGNTVYSSFGALPEIKTNAVAIKKLDKDRYVLVCTIMSDGKTALIYGKSIAERDSEFRNLLITYSLIAFGSSVLVALLLYFVLHKLTSPLEKLKTATESIAAGDYSVRADENRRDEFGDLGRSFNKMAVKVNAQMDDLKLNAEQKQRLVDNLAHEMRTPLTSIYGYAEYLRRTKTDEDDKIECAISIMNESQRLKKISEILLDTAYIRAHELRSAEVPLAPLLEETAERYRRKAEERGVAVEIDCGDISVRGDATLLSLLFGNFLENAVKACESGGRAVLSARDVNGVVEAKVCDNGKGMTEEQLKHITEPFYRTDRSRSRADGGAGLGLTLCRSIAEAHGARMEFSSEPGKGTEVFVIFQKDLQGEQKTMTT